VSETMWDADRLTVPLTERESETGTSLDTELELETVDVSLPLLLSLKVIGSLHELVTVPSVPDADFVPVLASGDLDVLSVMLVLTVCR
jgi:hypothetical protein